MNDRKQAGILIGLALFAGGLMCAVTTGQTPADAGIKTLVGMMFAVPFVWSGVK